MTWLPCRWVPVLAMLIATAPTETAQTSSIQIDGLHSTYGPKSTVSVVIRNLSNENIDVNVAVEALAEDHWREVLASITDPKHPYGKAVKLTPLKAGSSLPVLFVPVEEHGGVNPFGDRHFPISLRLRVDIYPWKGGKLIDSVRSAVFRISANPVSGLEPRFMRRERLVQCRDRRDKNKSLGLSEFAWISRSFALPVRVATSSHVVPGHNQCLAKIQNG